MDVSGTVLFFQIFGCAALLLWGARMVRTGITRAYGADIRALLGLGVGNRFAAAFLGLTAAAVLQSSTAVALLATSFASIGVLSETIGLALMLGADLGSAVITQFFALNIKDSWPLLMFVGLVCHAYFENRHLRARQFGRIGLGLGMIFLSLSVLADAAATLRSSDLVSSIFLALANEPMLAFLFAALLTWLAHSSLAILILAVTLAQGGLIADDRLALVFVLGVNAGAALPAFILTLSERPAARRIASGNLLFRLSGALLGMAFASVLLPYVVMLADDPGQRIVFIHIAFNLALLVLFLPLIDVVARLVKRLVPEQAVQDDPSAPRYLDNTAIDVPSVALSLAARETFRMIDIVETMLAQTMTALRNNNQKLCTQTQALDDHLDDLYEAIKLYVTELTRHPLESEEGHRAMEVISFTTHLEDIGDVIDKSLLDTVSKKIKAKRSFSDQGMAELERSYEFVVETIKLSASVFMNGTLDDARALVSRKEQFRGLEHESTTAHFRRLREGEVRTLETSAYHLDILRDLKRVNSQFAAVAYPIMEQAGKLRGSRLKK